MNDILERNLQRRLHEHRGTEDRTILLEDRLKRHRKDRPSQMEREARLLASDPRDPYADFVENHHTSALRVMDIVGAGTAEKKDVSAAISFRTGVLSLDHALGGGIPTGVTEIYGEESVGKTTLLIEMIKSAQREGLRTILCTSELFDSTYFARLGVNLGDLVIVRGSCGEEIFNIVLEMLGEEEKLAIFIDSGTGFRPSNDTPGAWLDMMLQFVEYSKEELSLGSSIVIVDQVRARRSIDPSKIFAGGTDSTARKISSLFNTRLELSREHVTDTSYDMMINIVANEYAPPSRFVSVPVVKGEGIDVWRDVVRVAAAVGVLEQRGHWYYFNNYVIGQGDEQAAGVLKSAPNTEVLDATLSRVF